MLRVRAKARLGQTLSGLPSLLGHLWAVGTMGNAAALLPHAIQRYAAIPVALAIAWLGYTLLTERRGRASERAPGTGSLHSSQIATE